MKKTGTTKTNANVPTSSPPTTPVPKALLPLAPAPDAKTSGSIPITIVITVISIGRNLAIAALYAASTIPMPLRLRSEAYSVIKMAVFAKSPISMMTPV